MDCKVEISARHIHLTENDYALLFGGKRPKEIQELSQHDSSCEQTVTVVGQKSTLNNVRLLVPFREKSQLEISETDARNLGISAPLKLSGDLPGETVKIIGPEGTIEKDIAIIAKRHLHLSTEDASELGLENNDVVKVKLPGERSLVFENIIVRTKETFTRALHIDTDEANAAGMSGETVGELILSE